MGVKGKTSARSAVTLHAAAQKLPVEARLNAKSAKEVGVGEPNEVCLRNARVFPHSFYNLFIMTFSMIKAPQSILRRFCR